MTLRAGCSSSIMQPPGSQESAPIFTKVSTCTVIFNFVIFSSNSVVAFESSSASDCLTNKESVFKVGLAFICDFIHFLVVFQPV